MIGRLVRAEDTVARLAPEVFALALPATPQTAARAAAERIAAVIGCTAFEAGEKRPAFVVDFDIGVAEVEPGETGRPGAGARRQPGHAAEGQLGRRRSRGGSGMDPQTAKLLPILLPVLILALVLRRNLQPRPLQIERMWLYPAILIFLLGSALYESPPTTMLAIGFLAVGLVLGAAAGWYRGRLTRITIDPETHALTSQASMWGTVLVVALIVVRYGLRAYLMGGLDMQPTPRITAGSAGPRSRPRTPCCPSRSA